MRVAFVIPYFYPAWEYGGPPRSAYDLARGLADKGVDVRVLSTDTGGRRRLKESEKTAGWPRVDVRYYRNVSNYMAFRHRIFMAPGFSIDARKQFSGCDVVHVHELRSMLTVTAFRAALDLGIPYVVSPHGGLLHLGKREAKVIFDKVWGNRILRHAAAVMAVSSLEADQARSCRVEPRRTRVLPNPIRVADYEDLPDGRRFKARWRIPESKLVLFLGRLNRIKGVDLLIRAFEGVPVDSHLVLAGSDDGEERFLRRIVPSSVRDRITFTGFLDREEKLSALVAADLCVVPSRDEIFGMVVLEALASETPVLLSSACGLIPELRGLSGVAVFETGNLDDLRSKLTTALNHERDPVGAVQTKRTVELSVENVTDQDFTAGGVVPSEAPALSFITPASVFSGTRLLNVTVLGTNFNPASVVEFNGSRLQTTFVSSVELQAVVSSTLLNRVGDAQITVTTPPPGGGTSGAAEFLVIAEPDNPLIEGRVSVGSFPAGVAIHPMRNLVLVTNEGSDNVSVIDLKTREVIETIEVGRSPGEGIDIHPGLDLAVVANVGSNNVSVIDLTTMTVTKTIDVGRFPVGVAIDTERDLAVVTNGEDSNVSFIHLPTLEVVFQIRVGERPAGVAINSRTGIAVVANRGADTVTLIDLDARSSVSTIGIEGAFPRAVAINETTNVAVVTNANSNAVALIDLETRRFIGAVAVGVGPSGVAIHELTNSAVVSNSGLSLGSSDLGALTTVEIIDLGGRTLVDSVPVGSTAFGVAVDEASQIAVVANFGSNDVTVIRIPNPTPQIDDVSPKTFPAGGGEFTITVQGSGFLPTSVVTLNGEALPTIYVSPTELQAVISAALLNELLQVSSISLDEGAGQRFAQTNPLQFNIGVTNPGPGGGESPPPSNPGAGQIQPSNSAPILLSISPTEIETGAFELELTLNGNNFNGTSVVDFGGSLHSPLTSTATSMTVIIPGSDLPIGVTAVSVTNPPPGGGTTTSLSFTVTEQSNPVPVVVSVSPQSVPAGSAAVGLSITGSGFISETEVSIDGETLGATITETSADATLSAELLRIPGTLTGFVTNPSPGGGTASFSINVLTPQPSISGFDPTTADAGLESLGLTVTGSNFSLNAFITVDGAEIPTRVISETQLDGTIPGVLLRSPGELAIGVTNPPPGGGSADGGNLTVQNPAPVLEALDPETVGLDALPASVVVTGGNFLPTSVVHVDGTQVDTTFIDSTSLSITLDVRASAGVLSVSVVNPDPGGGESGALDLTIGNPAPTIASVDPSEIGADQLPVTVTVTGGGFIPESQVELNAPADVGSVSVIDGRTLEFTLAAGTSAGVHTVTVTNPGPGGGTSNGESLRVTNPSPVVSRVQPDSGNATESTDVGVIGANFLDGAEILVDGEAIDTRFNGPTSLSGTVPPSSVGSLSISVLNPDGTESNAVGFNVIELPNPVPQISSVSPDLSTVKKGETITVTGTGFVPATEVFLDGQRLNVASLDDTTVKFVAPELADGSHTIKITNPPSDGGGGGTANHNFSVGVDPFTISPSSAEKLPNGTQQFSVVDGPSGATFSWSVNSIAGGNSTFGTITSGGFYTAPSSVPSPDKFKVCAKVSGSEACADVTIKAVPSAGEDLVVINDVNPFNGDRITDSNNKLMVKNLVSFTSTGSRNSGTVVQFDCGRSSRFPSACTSFDVMEDEITSAGMTVTKVPSSSGSLTSIPSNVKVLFLWLPTVPYKGVEINALKQFAADGGRIVFVGEHSGFLLFDRFRPEPVPAGHGGGDEEYRPGYHFGYDCCSERQPPYAPDHDGHDSGQDCGVVGDRTGAERLRPLLRTAPK